MLNVTGDDVHGGYLDGQTDSAGGGARSNNHRVKTFAKCCIPGQTLVDSPGLNDGSVDNEQTLVNVGETTDSQGNTTIRARSSIG